MPPREAAVIARADVPRWVSTLCARASVIAPTVGPLGDSLFAPVCSSDEILWEFENPLQPPKQFLLPQADPIIQIRRDNGHVRLEPVPDEGRQVLFNVRNCDATAFRYLAAAYARDLPDAAYARRVEATALVSLACTEPCALGFCVCCDAGPFLRDGFDLQLVPLGGHRILVEIGTAKGRALLEGAAGLFSAAAPDDLAERDALEAAARRNLGAETCHFGSAMRRISTRRVPQALWDAMSDWCLECGGCTHACPTCYCFSVSDRASDGGWTRHRIWDSCQYAAFTLEASGHNPRAEKRSRMWRRFFHKTSAQYCQRDGAVGCVGCGRCVKVCMGATDMPAVVGAIRKGAWHG